MKHMLLAAATALLCASPALAQMGSPTGGSMGTANGSMEPSMMTCQQMMDSTQPKVTAMSDGDQKTMAMHEMKMATDAMNMHHEKTCKKHMMKIMSSM